MLRTSRAPGRSTPYTVPSNYSLIANLCKHSILLPDARFLLRSCCFILKSETSAFLPWQTDKFSIASSILTVTLVRGKMGKGNGAVPRDPEINGPAPASAQPTSARSLSMVKDKWVKLLQIDCGSVEMYVLLCSSSK